MHKIRRRNWVVSPCVGAPTPLHNIMPTTITTARGAGNEEVNLVGGGAEGPKKTRCVTMMRKSIINTRKKERAAMTMPIPHAILLLVAVVLAISLEVAEGRRNKGPNSQ